MLMSQFIEGKFNPSGVLKYTDSPLGLLTFLGPKTLEEMQRHLETYEEGYGQTLQALELFLLSARQEGLVDQNSDGKWNLLSGT